MKEIINLQFEAINRQIWASDDEQAILFGELLMHRHQRLFPDGDPPDPTMALTTFALLHGTMIGDEQALFPTEVFCDMDQYVSLSVDQYVSLGDRPEVAAALNFLTLQYWTRGDYEPALSLAKQALEMQQRLCPGDDPELALSLTFLAWLCGATEDYEQALFVAKQALAMQQRLCPGDDPELATALKILVWLHGAMGDYEPALSLAKQVLEMQQRLHPGDERDSYNISG